MQPWKKIALAALAGAIIVLAGFAATRSTTSLQTYQAPQKSVEIDALGNPSEPLTIDSDGDGLADWEEALWRSDPHNADTDGDGVSDGDEVKANRDPLVAGAGNLVVRAAATSSPSTSLTTTDKLSQEIVAAYLKLKLASETGGSTDALSPESIIEQNLPPISATLYSQNAFTTVTDSDANVLAYRDRFFFIFETRLPPGEQDEFEVLRVAVQKGTGGGEIQELKDVSAQYHLAIQDLLSMNVPRKMLSLHTRFVNTLSFAAASMEGMSKIFTDPILGAQAVEMYLDSSTLIDNQLEEFRFYFEGLGEQSTAL